MAHFWRAKMLQDSPQPTKESPIESVLSELHKNISVLEEAFSHLRAKTHSASTPEPSTGEVKSGAAPAIPRSVIWCSVDEASTRLALLTVRTRELTSRLET
jgi:hypothetical protein